MLIQLHICIGCKTLLHSMIYLSSSAPLCNTAQLIIMQQCSQEWTRWTLPHTRALLSFTRIMNYPHYDAHYGCLTENYALQWHRNLGGLRRRISSRMLKWSLCCLGGKMVMQTSRTVVTGNFGSQLSIYRICEVT